MLKATFKSMNSWKNWNFTLAELKEGVDHFKSAVECGYNPNFNSRTIVGDNPNDPYEKSYGNNDLKGGDPKHGTHVAGLIGANRKNDIGIKGIADNVEIIAIRVVPPNGDERDKDIANGIIYAVDNGAQIINMSFGKDYSPYKEAIDKAVKYAEQKGVLLMHAAGNESENLDNTSQFPSRYYKNKKAAPELDGDWRFIVGKGQYVRGIIFQLRKKER